MKEGSLLLAQKSSRSLRKEPLLLTQAFFNAVQQGTGVNLDAHLPSPAHGSVADSPDALLDRGAFIVLSDGEPKQSLHCIFTHVSMYQEPGCAAIPDVVNSGSKS